MVDAPRISVVIPTLDRPVYVAAALAALRRGSFEAYEVLVMDQSDRDATERAVLSLEDQRIRYIAVPRRGVCPARNLGAAMARAPLVAFVDDDCEPRDDWLARIAGTFERNPRLQFIFGELRAPAPATARGGYPEVRPGDYPPHRRRSRTVAMIAAGANMAARKDFLRRIGGFDEVLGPDVPDAKGDDCSISYKVWRSGEQWVASPDISVEHTNGFREHAQLHRLYAGYYHALGITYARFARRGDLRALETFLVEQVRMAWWPLRCVLLLRRPQGLRNWWAHLSGFARGLRLPPHLGHIDGTTFRTIEDKGLV
ncbi:MAG: glycosyltransferase [Dehalococcoidia bacterium]|nr:glycosyltransferase [Dehalococcoidia bacterium]